ncbi:hypothetical protein [Vibrio spartinae]|uniref:Uncharacterized protein n=1 Tax=Vibrio spartinae TaxID=1918945 RepID=A0ABX6R5Z8_9VIBR|nr:hypothetical protein [Vibrio spartinae]QMV16335.1 hypothetical protein Vspart_03721 [Vibrio spartinae]
MGGIGTVSTKITLGKSDNVWKYGGDAAFNYSTLASSTTIAMTYDGSKESKGADVEINCSSSYYGNCVKADTDEWFKIFANKSYAELSDVKPLEMVSFDVSVPKIPAFKSPKPEPEEEEEITENIKKIDNLEGLAVFATLSAYDEAKQRLGGDTLTLKQFMEDAQKPADNKPLLAIEDAVKNNEIDPLNPYDELDAIWNHTAEHKVTMIPASSEQPKQDSESDLSDFQPLGVWIANWSDLFPWLAVGYDNNISNIGKASILLKSRTFIQDLRALSILYQIISNGNYLSTTGNTGAAQQIANSYTSVLNQFVKNTEFSQKIINRAFDSLSQSAKIIYTFWCKNPIFRSAELGFGVIASYSDSNKTYSMTPPTTPFSTTARMIQCELDPNRSCFASFVKLLPVFEVDDNDDVIVKVIGQGSQYLNSIYTNDVEVRALFGHAYGLQLTVETEEKYLLGSCMDGNNKVDIRLYPVPLSAAVGGNWMGQNISTPLSAFSDLNEQFKEINKQMQGMTSWSLSSKSWDNRWNGDTPYSPRTVETQYFGLVSEPIGIFGAHVNKDGK